MNILAPIAAPSLNCFVPYLSQIKLPPVLAVIVRLSGYSLPLPPFQKAWMDRLPLSGGALHVVHALPLTVIAVKCNTNLGNPNRCGPR